VVNQRLLPLHPERKLLTGCRHRELVPVYLASAPPLVPLYIMGYPGVTETVRSCPLVGFMCLTCEAQIPWAFAS
jgi:hypothetical protein